MAPRSSQPRKVYRSNVDPFSTTLNAGISANAPGPDEEEQRLTNDALEQAHKLVAANKQRRDGRRKALAGEHAKKTKEVSKRITTLFDDRKTRVTRSQRAQWDRLHALNERRAIIEAQILASMRAIQVHTINMTSELIAMLDGRKEEVIKGCGEAANVKS